MLTLPFLFVCCTSEQEQSIDPAPLVDDLGRQVELTQKPTRIISLAPNVTELLCAAGAGGQIVGISHADDYPPEILDRPRFSSFPLNVEAVVALRPDLVVAIADVNPMRSIQALEEVGIPVFVLDFSSLSDTWTALITLGKLTGNQPIAEEMRNSILARLDAVKSSRDSTLDPPSVLVLLGTDRLYSFGGDSYMTQLIELSGGISMTEHLPGPSAVLSEEAVMDADPDFIVGAFLSDDMASLLSNHPSWRVLTAFRRNQLCTIHPDLLLRPGPRLVEGIEAMAACLARQP